MTPANGICVEGGTVVLTATEQTGLINPALVYTWSSNSAATTNTATYTCTTAGAFTVSVTAVGSLTAVSAPIASSITVKNAVPLITSAIFNPATAAVGEPVQLTVLFTDASPNNLYTLTVVWGDNSANTQISTTDPTSSVRSLTTSHSFAKPGQASVSITVKDSAGAVTAPYSSTFKVTQAVSETPHSTSP